MAIKKGDYGPVLITSGRLKGQIGYYDFEERLGKKELVGVFVGGVLPGCDPKNYILISLSALSKTKKKYVCMYNDRKVIFC